MASEDMAVSIEPTLRKRALKSSLLSYEYEEAAKETIEEAMIEYGKLMEKADKYRREYELLMKET